MTSSLAARAFGTAALERLLSRGLTGLQRAQYQEDGADWYRGEFPMRLSGRTTRQDHNFLSGYALLHIAAARRSRALPSACSEAIATLLDTGRDLPKRYANEKGQCNWYHGKMSGCAAPPDFDWHKGVVLCLCQDVDDTSIATQLRCLCDLDVDRRAMIDQFGSIALRRAEVAALGYRSRRRLQLTEVDAGVYQTWFLPGPDAEEIRRTAALPLPVKMVPDVNSVELVTSANIWTAVWLLGGHDELRESQQATAAFVNRLVRHALQSALDGDPGQLRYAAPYYPWVPFAPLAFLVRNHCLARSALLYPSTLDLIVEALKRDELCRADGESAFPALAYALNCAAWCAHAGCLPPAGTRLAADRWSTIVACLDASGQWPDFVFFNQAHIGDYGGNAHSQALMIETMALLLEALA